MDDFIPRNITEKLDSLLSYFPIVGITGPRQCGKTTLVKEFTRKRRDKKYLYLDLEYDEDLAKLSNPVAFFYRYQDYCLPFVVLLCGFHYGKLQRLVNKTHMD